MPHKSFPHLLIRIFLILLLFAASLPLHSCSNEENPKIIDFSETIPGTRPPVNQPESPRLRFAIGAMISPKATFIHYRELLDYVGKRLNMRVELVQRKTYREVNEMLRKGEIDIALICSGPYMKDRNEYGFEAIATPIIRGSHFYRSYLVTNKESPYQTLQDLQGRVFAFTDPDSLTGRLVPAYWLSQMGFAPRSFFSEIIFTYSHDNSIMAVARGLVDGAAVDGLVWDYLAQVDPIWTSKTRIIKKSMPFGIPPLVASRSLSPQTKLRVQQMLFAMHNDATGREILKKLMIDSFMPPKEEWYRAIREIEGKLTSLQEKSDALH